MNSHEPVVPPRSRRTGGRTAASRVLVIAGFAFAAVGLVDLLLLWFPLQLSNVAWEYATVGRTLDSMPMPALGMILVAYGFLSSPAVEPRTLTLVSGMFAVLGVLSLCVAFLLVTAAPAVLSQTPDMSLDAVQRAAARHVVQSLLYPIAWFWIAAVVWRSKAAE